MNIVTKAVPSLYFDLFQDNLMVRGDTPVIIDPINNRKRKGDNMALNEADRKRPQKRRKSPGYNYTEKRVKGAVDRVILTFGKEASGESGQLTRIGNEFLKIKRILDIIARRKDQLNRRVTERMETLFNAEDQVLTRVIETATVAMTLAKKTTRKSEYVDMDSLVKALVVLMPELKQKVEELAELFTTRSEEETKPALRVTGKEKDKKVESITEDSSWLSKFMDRAKLFLERFTLWGTSYDRQLDKIKSQL